MSFAPVLHARCGPTVPASAARVVVAWHGLPFYAVRLLDRAVRDHPDCSFSFLTTASDDHQKHGAFSCVVGVPVRRVEDQAGLTWCDLGMERPDVFVFTSWSHPAYLSLAAEARRARGTRLVVMMDNIYHGRPRQWAGALWFRAVFRRRIDWLWVPGRRGRAFGRFLGMPADRIVEGLYGADPAIFVGNNEADRSGVLFVGQLIERKGVPAMLEASLRDPSLGRRLTLVGAGPLESRLQSSGLRVRPFAPAATLAGDYAKSSLFLLPSAVDHWGVVLHEAALAGCLLVATRRCGAASDLIEHGRNGFIMNDSSSGEILRAVAWHDQLDADRVRVGRELSRIRARRFGPEAFSRAFTRFLV